MDESPFSDGSTASLIENFHVNEQGFLVSQPSMTYLLPAPWVNTQGTGLNVYFSKPEPLVTTIGMGFMMRDGEAPEILLLDGSGVWRFAPWNRSQSILTSTEDVGIEEQREYAKVGGGSYSVKPISTPRYPSQVETVANRIYFSYCDGGSVWCWDGHRIRRVGFTQKPSPPDALGPARENKNATGKENSGGWSHRGRIGNAESNWTEEGGSGPAVHTVGGVDVGHWRYAVVYEGTDGAYSAMSDPGGMVSIRKQVCQYTGSTIEEKPDELLKKFRLLSIPHGPDNCIARIILRTRNLQRLPPGDDGSFRFVHRIPNTVATDYIDDIPDGELGAPWQDREPFPIGPYFIRHFNGSMWYMRTESHPSRVWWSEQESFSGPIPESILFGHWMDVYPSTGPITGSFSASIPGSKSPALLVFKENATHYVGGGYPSWQLGTLHPTAGCAGPSLVQADPSGNIVWYGSGTFWRLGPEGVEDVGKAITKRLQGVNSTMARMGVSWFDAKNKELVFWLPMHDSTKPNMGFVWDYVSGGWRILTHMTEVNACLSIPNENMILVAGAYEGTTGSGIVDYGVSVYGRGWKRGRGCSPFTTAVYKTGWVGMSEFGPEMHASKRGAWLVVSGEDANLGASSVSVFKNHNNIDPVTEPQYIESCHPEEDVAAMDHAVFNSDVWREPRFFSTQVPVDAPNARTLQVSLSTGSRVALFNIDLYGPVTSGKFSRASGGEG